MAICYPLILTGTICRFVLVLEFCLYKLIMSKEEEKQKE